MKRLQNEASKIRLSPYIYCNVKIPHWLPALQTLPGKFFMEQLVKPEAPQPGRETLRGDEYLSEP